MNAFAQGHPASGLEPASGIPVRACVGVVNSPVWTRSSPDAPRAPDLASYPPLSPGLGSPEAELESAASSLRSRGLGAGQRPAAEEKFACSSSASGARGLDLLGQAPPGGSSRARKGVRESGWTPHDDRV